MASSLRCTRFTEVQAALDALARAVDPAARGTGRFTLAQAVEHCAQSVECSMTGYPELRSGFFRATIGPLVKRKFLRAGSMSHDTSAGIAGAPDPAAGVDLAVAIAHLGAAIARFQAFEAPLAPHLAYGRCSKADYEALHSMHIADHLGAWI
jgi:hypothetical protein